MRGKAFYPCPLAKVGMQTDVKNRCEWCGRRR